MVKLLIENGATVSANDTLGKTPLHCAAERGHVRVAKLLLRRNANLTLISNDGWTPLHCAAFQGKQEMVCMLLQKGAYATALDRSGFVPMQIVEQPGHSLIANILRHSTRSDSEESLQNPVTPSSEPQPDSIRNDRITFKLAIYDGIVEEVCRLIDNGVDISIPDDFGWMPLHSAAAHEHEGVVQELIRRGADVSFRDERGWTTAQWAANEEHTGVAEFLETIPNKNAGSGRDRDGDDWYLV